MEVYKFGGVSLASPEAVKNVAKIMKDYPAKVLVVSAMGKMTNAFEFLVESYMRHLPEKQARLDHILDFHQNMVENLFQDNNEAREEVHSLLEELTEKLSRPGFVNYRKTYDQIVPFGELLSSLIVSHYFRQEGIKNNLLDARKWLHTDDKYGEANVDLRKSQLKLTGMLSDVVLNITQGFIGGNSEGFATTLGREGSDFTAALIAQFTGASSVTIWKDVPGLLNADPQYFHAPVLLQHISYHEAVELAFYGAKVIHPKTIKPLQNHNIPLLVKSFKDPEAAGSVIDCQTTWDGEITSFILKKHQTLLTFRTKDFSFMAEEHLYEIYGQFKYFGLKANLMQHSAITLSVCVDHNIETLGALLGALAMSYDIKYNLNLDLITLRHYNEAALRKVTKNREIMLEQRSRITAQVVLK
ncbi:MAG: aspartate kinase [Bacteroidota bacterium]